ncbi:hypothetical protein OFY17_13520 [Marinomonas sp. C2222]|uniref:Uncharacterized protein n=1 Tax=Marinomonas sargassi TaxID=2984494 RepID=A0ABT2YVG2_9GAMM|nr:hypothetical protein [Marinomonas sargassi]MCV2403886.1 hypothetical protein [Marinomonas sargassi]
MKYWSFIFCLFFASSLYADGQASLNYAHVQSVKAVEMSKGSWCFHVAVRHNDEGWEHYADAWQVIDDQGVILGERVLLHPHVNEQPFTRSLCGVQIPVGTESVRVRAKCNQHGFGGKEVIVDFSVANSEDYSVIR